MLPTLDESARQLSASGEYRVLRRVPPVERWELAEPTGDVVRAVIADVEATGLGDADEVIELGLLPVDYCRATGLITAVHLDRALDSLREPSVPITPESQQIHGITPEMVSGKTITSEQVAAAMDGAQIVICHNAGYDRPKLEVLWSETFEPLCFACSLDDVPWRAEGLQSAKLDYLLWRQGWFHEGHRALDDALATAFLMTLPLPRSGRPAMSALLENARKPMTMIQAIDTNFDHKDLLKNRSYRWEPGGNGRVKAWCIVTTEPEAEVEWLTSSKVWQRGSRYSTRVIAPRHRFTNRVHGAP